MSPFRSESFGNGLQVDFTDLSNRYFGDYFRVCIEVTLLLDLVQVEQCEPDASLTWQRARSVFGDRFSSSKKLERMGVSGADVEAVRQKIVDDFLNATRRYLLTPGYLRSLVDAELKKKRPTRTYGF